VYGRSRARQLNPSFPKPRDGLTQDGTMIYFARKQDCHAQNLRKLAELIPFPEPAFAL
jgi:hypothetical protein